MTTTIFVGSKSLPTVMVPVEASGFDRITAERAAIQFARARHRIFDPIVLNLNEHAAAVALRLQVLAEHQKPMPPLNGSGEPSWRRRDRVPLYDER